MTDAVTDTVTDVMIRVTAVTRVSDTHTDAYSNAYPDSYAHVVCVVPHVDVAHALVVLVMVLRTVRVRVCVEVQLHAKLRTNGRRHGGLELHVGEQELA